MKFKQRSILSWLALSAVALLAGCERPPIEAVQHGFRGTGMVEVYNPRIVVKDLEKNVVPDAPPAAGPGGPASSTVYQNVQVLGDLSVGEFTRTMVSMTAWVAPEQGCAYCHNVANYASDEIYTKVVARKMLQMTHKINADYKTHVADTGVTCYTCHRGNNIPENVWFTAGPEARSDGMLGDRAGQNTVSVAGAYSSLPEDPFTPYFLEARDIRVQGETALPTGNAHSTKQTEWTYSLMNHMSTSLGVNCTYCHNTRSFGSWETSPPQRVTAWYGIQMVRDLNNEYMKPLTEVFPAHRLGPTGDVAKSNCTTCHQGAYKPMYGKAMAKDYPAMYGAPSPGMAASAPELVAQDAAAPAVEVAAK